MFYMDYFIEFVSQFIDIIERIKFLCQCGQQIYF